MFFSWANVFPSGQRTVSKPRPVKGKGKQTTVSLSPFGVPFFCPGHQAFAMVQGVRDQILCGAWRLFVQRLELGGPSHGGLRLVQRPGLELSAWIQEACCCLFARFFPEHVAEVEEGATSREADGLESSPNDVHQTVPSYSSHKHMFSN